MATRASRYYGEPFPGSRGIIQGGPLSPRIFNIVVGAIVRNWFGMVAKNKDGPGDFGCTVAEKAAFFHADNGMVYPNNTVWLQWIFNDLIGLFERFRIRTNVEKAVAMV